MINVISKGFFFFLPGNEAKSLKTLGCPHANRRLSSQARIGVMRVIFHVATI